MAQIDDLQSNVNKLTNTILTLNEPVGTIQIDWSKYLLTPRQIAKNLALSAAPTLTDSTGAPIPVNEKSVHTAIYGKYMVGSDGKVVDNEILHPECVDHNRAMPDNHPALTDKVPNMTSDLKVSMRVLNIKKSKLADDIKLAGKQIATGLLVIAESLAPIPKPNMGISAVQGVVAAINTLISSVMDIIPLLGPLITIPLLIAEAFIETILGITNGLLTALLAILGLISDIKKSLNPVIALVL